MLTAGTLVDVYLDAEDGTIQLSGVLDADYDGTVDSLTLRRSARTTVIPASRVLYVEEQDRAGV